jgi:heterotetrameric sarcosine oxidase gamma subunit
MVRKAAPPVRPPVRTTPARRRSDAAHKPATPRITVKRVSPLAAVYRQGRFGAEHGDGPGVRLALRHPVSIVTIIARKGKAKALSAAMKAAWGVDAPAPGSSASGRGGITVHWCGAEQYYAVAEGLNEGALFDDAVARLGGLASVSDQSHGRSIMTVSGPMARHVLTKGTPVDLHPNVFAQGNCAVTQIAHVGVHLARVGPETYELSLFRGFAENFWEWLTEMALEFGYEVV